MKEEEIRKQDAFNKYLALAREDADKFFANRESFIYANCPGCGSSLLQFEFEQHNFKYVSCVECATLFVNPRPPQNKLNDFYVNSPSADFWINEFFKPVAEPRREKIFKPRADYVNNTFLEKPLSFIGDIGAGFGIFLEELRKIRQKARLIAIEPSLKQAEICRSKGLEICNCTLEEIEGFDEKFDLLTAFELFEHLFDPENFLRQVRRLLNPKAYFLFTTLNIYGFDIQLLWERSKSMQPPHHLNFFNPTSISLLLERCGFEVIEISTPGRLDWDIVEGMIKNENLRLGRFWDLLANKVDPACKQEFQEWISRNNLSSHMRILARKS
jgi:SAM-dependent methyltransferase